MYFLFTHNLDTGFPEKLRPIMQQNLPMKSAGFVAM